jgi:hypothetical protein
MTDLATELLFVNQDEVQTTYRICLAGEPGDGKTLAAATAPGPLLVLNADRPAAWDVAKRRHPDKDIRETRYVDHTSLEATYRYLATPGGSQVGTVVVDPWSNIYDQLCATAPKKLDNRDGEMKPDYEMVNSKLLGFITALRRFDVHVVIVTHLKENDGKKGDGKTYARFGGMGLIRKAMAEMDVIALIRRTTPEDGEPVWFAEVQPTDAWAGKDGTDTLGARRVADLTRWVELARAANMTPTASDLPWADDAVLPAVSGNPDAPTEAAPQGSGAAVLPPGDDAPAELPSSEQVDEEQKRIEAEVAADIEAENAALTDESVQAALAASPGTPTVTPELTETDWQVLDAYKKHDRLIGRVAVELGCTVNQAKLLVSDLRTRFGVRSGEMLLARAAEMERGT